MVKSRLATQTTRPVFEQGAVYDFYPNGGRCFGADSVDDCELQSVECPNGDLLGAAGRCWSVCNDKYTDAIASIDVAELAGGTLLGTRPERRAAASLVSYAAS